MFRKYAFLGSMMIPAIVGVAGVKASNLDDREPIYKETKRTLDDREPIYKETKRTKRTLDDREPIYKETKRTKTWNEYVDRTIPNLFSNYHFQDNLLCEGVIGTEALTGSNRLSHNIKPVPISMYRVADCRSTLFHANQPGITIMINTDDPNSISMESFIQILETGKLPYNFYFNDKTCQEKQMKYLEERVPFMKKVCIGIQYYNANTYIAYVCYDTDHKKYLYYFDSTKFTNDDVVDAAKNDTVQMRKMIQCKCEK
jgi:hypothetical protein